MLCVHKLSFTHICFLQACRVSFPGPGAFTLLIKFVTWCGTIHDDMWELIAPHRKCDGSINDHCAIYKEIK